MDDDTLVVTYSIPISDDLKNGEFFTINDGEYTLTVSLIENEDRTYTYAVTQTSTGEKPLKGDATISIHSEIKSITGLMFNDPQQEVELKVNYPKGIINLSLGPITKSNSQGQLSGPDSWGILAESPVNIEGLKFIVPNHGLSSELDQIEECKTQYNCFEFLLSGPATLDLKVFTNLAVFVDAVQLELNQEAFESLPNFKIKGQELSSVKRLVLIWDGSSTQNINVRTGAYILNHIVNLQNSEDGRVADQAIFGRVFEQD